MTLGFVLIFIEVEHHVQKIYSFASVLRFGINYHLKSWNLLAVEAQKTRMSKKGAHNVQHLFVSLIVGERLSIDFLILILKDVNAHSHIRLNDALKLS